MGVTGFIVVVVLASLVIVGALLVAHDQSAAPTAAEADVDVVAGKSYCTASGGDLYTGDGHVQFFLTLTNSGGEPDTVSITPVRHYDDGQINLSALDTVEVEVAAHETWRGRTPAYTYKAHAHEVIGCGVIADGGDEITIEALRL